MVVEVVLIAVGVKWYNTRGCEGDDDYENRQQNVCNTLLQVMTMEMHCKKCKT